MDHVPERFWSKVDRDGPIATLRPDLGPCWIWTAGRLKPRARGHGGDGYGIFTWQNKLVRAHRWLYEQVHGPIADGLVLDHFACERRECVNPKHVRPVTPRENVLRSDGPASLNLAKNECPRGHPYDDANTMRLSKGGRYCRTCHRAQTRASMQRLRDRQAAARAVHAAADR